MQRNSTAHFFLAMHDDVNFKGSEDTISSPVKDTARNFTGRDNNLLAMIGRLSEIVVYGIVSG